MCIRDSPPRASRPAGLDDVGVHDAGGARSSTERRHLASSGGAECCRRRRSARPGRGVEAGDHADEHRESHACQGRPGWQVPWPALVDGIPDRDQRTQGDSAEPAERGQDEGLGDELSLDLSAGGATGPMAEEDLDPGEFLEGGAGRGQAGRGPGTRGHQVVPTIDRLDGLQIDLHLWLCLLYTSPSPRD